MIKKTVLFTVTLSAMASAILAADTQAKVSFALGDVVHIDTCDKWQWCKLKDNSGYVKGHLFKRFPKDPSIAIKRTKGNTYLYNIRPVYKDDKPLFEFIQKENPVREMLFAQDNYQYGYIREKDIADYETYINTQQIQKPKKEVAKQDVTQKVEEIVGKTQESNSKDINEVKLEDTNEVVSDAEVQTKNNIETKHENTNSDIFIYGGVGKSLASIKNDSGTAITEVKDNYNFFELGVGYNYDANYFAMLGAQKSSNTQTDTTNILASVNYKFSHILLKPFVGISGGYSELKWKKDPITSSQKDTTATKFFLGLQGGASYKVDEKFSIYGLYQYLPIKHKTIIENQGDIMHSSFSNIQIGVKYDL
jgi:opacity protein-like surface antigen